MKYATDIFLGDGTTAAFDLTFDYLQRDHVHVYIVASDQPGATRTELTVVDTGSPAAGEYLWSTNNRITVGTAPPTGEYLWIQRETPEDQQIVQWVDGSYIVATDLNTSDKQWLYSIQELHDLIDTINGADFGNAVKGITVTAPLESDVTDPQIPILSVDEAVSTDDPNALTSDVQLMSAKAIDLAFSQAVGSTSSYPPGGVTAKVGKLLVDTTGSDPCLYYWTGGAWSKIYAEDSDLSTTDDLPEGSVNLYYTDARVEAYVSGAGYIKNLTGLDTDDLAEGSANLYYTDARVEAYVNGAGYIKNLTGLDTDDLPEGSVNLYFTDARVNTWISSNLSNTDQLTEGSGNLYYTNARVETYVSGAGYVKGSVVTKIIAGANIGISPASGTGQVTITASGGGGGSGIPEAPLDSTLYGRENAAWVAVPDPGIADAPSNGSTYGRKDAGWSVVDTGIADAPSDNVLYARENASWVAVPDAGIADAPSDGDTYARKDAGWIVIDPSNAVDSVNGKTGVVSLAMSDLTDVDTTSTGHVPSDGQYLVWHASMNHWMPGTLPDNQLDIAALPSLP